MTPTAYLATVRHVRTTPLRHDFTYRTVTWAVPLDGPDPNSALPWWQKPFIHFRPSDHLGDSSNWRDNIVAFAATHDLDASSWHITALSGAATAGYAFDPLTVYWCTEHTGEPVAVIAEVRNTYGQRHAYLVRPDSKGVARAEKRLYVSPFNDMSGGYTMSVPPPDRSGFDVRVTLHRPGERPFVATWTGARPRSLRERLLLAVHMPFAAQVVTARIRLQGVRLWARRLPIQPRPDHSEELT